MQKSSEISRPDLASKFKVIADQKSYGGENQSLASRYGTNKCTTARSISHSLNTAPDHLVAF